MSVIDLDTPPRKPTTTRLKPATDRVTRERAEHPDRIPRDPAPHPVTRAPARPHGPGRDER